MVSVLEMENAKGNMKVYYNKIKRKFYMHICNMYVCIFCICATRSSSSNGLGSFIIHERCEFLCDIRLCDKKMEDASLSKMLFDKVIFLANQSFRVCVCVQHLHHFDMHIIKKNFNLGITRNPFGWLNNFICIGF